jgi:hypothetical protein
MLIVNVGVASRGGTPDGGYKVQGPLETGFWVLYLQKLNDFGDSKLIK